jgi:hypothetical protein
MESRRTHDDTATVFRKLAPIDMLDLEQLKADRDEQRLTKGECCD